MIGGNPVSQDDRKRAVGRQAAELVQSGMIVGLGTGSTAAHLVERLGERVREGLRIRAVPTSERTAEQAARCGIELVTLDQCPELDLAIDGADQVDPAGHLIKGLGGALYREKLVARASREFVVIVDADKMVDRLGEGCPVPVEIERAEEPHLAAALRAHGADPRLRGERDAPYVTDNGNWILDAHFGAISDPASLEREINGLTGVLDNGLFPAMTDRVLIGDPSGVREWRPTRPGAQSTGS
jgi:ribose 5-phosphate isomerase A